MSKSEFIRSLQAETIALSPFDISQKMRLGYSCLSAYKGDPELDIESYRGYMHRVAKPPGVTATPEDPELYLCVISLNQSKQWQDLVWTKEILGILDHERFRTRDKTALGHMIDHRDTSGLHSDGTPPNVRADRDGLTLALGCLVPLGYRRILREQKYLEKYSLDQLESILPVPAQFIERLLGDGFEADFEAALGRCDYQAS